MKTYTFKVEPFANLVAGCFLIFLWGGGSLGLLILAVSDEPILWWHLAFVLFWFLLGFLILPLRETFIVSRGKIVKRTTFLFIKSETIFTGTNVFLRENTGGAKTAGPKNFTYEFYIADSKSLRPPTIFLGNYERLILNISQEFIIFVAKDFENEAEFQKKEHFFFAFEGGKSPDDHEIWGEPGHYWETSRWAKIVKNK